MTRNMTWPTAYPATAATASREIDDSEPLPTAKGRSYYVEKRWWQFWK